MVAALFVRNAPGDSQAAQRYLKNIGLAQKEAPHTDHQGIVAASHNGLRTGDGDKYYAALHIGATSWYCIAAQQGNSFQM